ncbi:MAG TPA: HAD-IA family hydrolase [Acidimicrobiales bacterium]|nr:HAD-IA family hydrolase [Acidimicrobiales bacterium]
MPDLDPERLPEAFVAGDRYLLDWDRTAAEAGYRSARAGYHRAILGALGVERPTDELIEDLDRPLPFSQIVEPFEDVEDGLEQLRGDGWAIAIVADTGAGMIELYRQLELDRLIDAFVISEDIGVSKPDPRMYHSGSNALRLGPSECVFVDNCPENVRAALSLGYHACGISRYGDPPTDGLQWVRDLTELSDVLGQLREASRLRR